MQNLQENSKIVAETTLKERQCETIFGSRAEYWVRRKGSNRGMGAVLWKPRTEHLHLC